MQGPSSSPDATSSSSVVVVVESRASVVTASSLNQAFSLPKDGDALSLVSDADAHTLKLHLAADLALVGTNSRRMAFSTHKLFGEMLNTLQASGASHAARSEEEFTRAFHTHLTAVLLNQTNVQLIRSPSMEHLLQEVASAEGLLSQGIEPYLSAMRRVLRQAVLDAHSVQVVLSEYSYSVPRVGSGGRDSNKSGNKPTTVGSLLTGLCCFPVLIPKYLYERQAALREPLLAAAAVPDKEIRVLGDVTCLIRPARLTLVLGPPGSGKTSLLRAMSGKLLSKPTTGELQYNGRPVDELHNLANWSAYVSQSDDHMPLLTVRETITHAFKCRKEIRFRAAEQDLPQAQRDMLDAYRQLEVDVFLAVLGLARCADTIIGNETLKGISGGEKRRVTLGEMLAVGSQVLCLDEISTGLDSAATFDICQYLRHVAHLMDTCVVVALLQPAPEVMDLFDDILVIAEGQIIFHGERHACLPYFESLGFHRPDSKDIADFIQELPTPGGLREFRLGDADLIERGITQLPPTSVSELVYRWKHSILYQQEEHEVKLSLHHVRSEGGDIDSLPQNSWFTQLQLAMSWSWMVRMKNKIKLRAKLIQNVVMGLLLGTLFFQIPNGEAYRKNILFFQVLMISGQSALTEVQTNVKARSIYHKHVDQHFYSAWMLSLAQTLTTIPIVVADTAIFGQLIYWLTGLAPEIWHFALFCMCSVLYGCAMQSIMGTFPYLFREEMTGTGGAGLFMLVSCLLAGTIATTDVIPSYLMPLYWANPLAYAVRILANIEYLSPGYDDNPCLVELNGRSIQIPQRCGDFYLQSRQISEGWEYVHQGMLVLVGCLVVFWLITTLALTYVRFDPIPAEKKKVVEEEEGEEVQLSVDLSIGHTSVVAPKQITLAVYKLGYTITKDTGEEMDLLSGVSMWAQPGRMLALMGSSGAGKTTLLDVLAGVKSMGKVRGRVFLNGKPSTRSEFNNLAGYVQQFGIHNERSTIRESLLFSMRLRLGETDVHVQNKFLDEILALLELDSIQDIYCGQCSMEQNKRLTMGVELVANPSVIFADEPTSSLDARAAQIVIRVLKRVAASGRTVIATIHQPSVEIFSQFDDLLLLKTGGKVAYFGEIGQNAHTMVSYFEGFSFVPFDHEESNPAAWMLDVIGGGTGLRKKANEDVDFADVYSQSDLCKANEQHLLDDFGIASELLTQAHISNKLERYNAIFKTSIVRQFYLVLHRNMQTMWRSPEFTLMQIAVVVMFGLMFVSLFYQQQMAVMADVQSRILCITFSMSMASMNLMMALIPFLMNRRALFYREHSSGMYHSAVFVLAFGIAQLPSLIINSIISVNIVYFGVGYNQTALFPYIYYMGSSMLFMVVLTAFGMLVACALPEPLSAQLAASVFFNIMNVFAGIPVPIKAMPVQYKWIHYISPMRWFYEGILSTQFHGNQEIICNPLGIPVTEKIMGKLHLCTSTGKADWHKITGVQVPIENYVLDDFLWGYKYAHKWDDMAVLLAWVFGLVLLTVLATKYISYDNR